MNYSINFYGNAVHPPGASPWGMRLQIALLFPQKPRDSSVGLFPFASQPSSNHKSGLPFTWPYSRHIGHMTGGALLSLTV